MLQPIEDHKVFWNVSRLPDKNFPPEDYKLYNKYEKKVYDKVKERPDGSPIYRTTRYRICDIYNDYTIIDSTKIENPNTKLFFNKKFRLPCHKLEIIATDMDGISELPKDLLVFYIEGSEFLFNFPVSIIPINLVSLTLRFCNFPFGNKDLSHLKNLKVINFGHTDAIEMPKLPKDIEYIDCEVTKMGSGFGQGVKNFHLKDHKKLKHFNVSESSFTKKRKNIPIEWIKAKAVNKMKIWW